MSEHVVETIKHRGLTIKIIPDHDSEGPREENDNVGRMVCWSRRNRLGDETRKDDPQEWLDSLAEDAKPGIIEWLDNKFYLKMVPASYPDPNYEIQRKQWVAARNRRVWKIIDRNYIILPLALLDHSGLHMWVGSKPHFSDAAGWDSGQCGWIYCTRAKAIEEWGGKSKRLTKRVRAAAEKYLTGEVTEYDQWLTGDVYGYVVEDEDGCELDSCWGFYGLQYAREEGISAANGEADAIGRAAAESAGDVPMGVMS